MRKAIFFICSMLFSSCVAGMEEEKRFDEREDNKPRITLDEKWEKSLKEQFDFLVELTISQLHFRDIFPSPFDDDQYYNNQHTNNQTPGTPK